jgi:hypothetical protein
LTHLMITTEQSRGADVGTACESILREMLMGTHDDDVCLLIADFSPGK